MTLKVATDGGCINNPGPGGWAWYVDEDNWASGALDDTTNNVMELTAILRAATDIPGHLDIELLVDSQYAIKATSHGKDGWVDGWIKKGWRTAGGSPVKNVELIQAAVAALDARTGSTIFTWVKGHAGHELNSLADEIANRRARRQSWHDGPGWTGANTVSSRDTKIPTPEMNGRHS